MKTVHVHYFDKQPLVQAIQKTLCDINTQTFPLIVKHEMLVTYSGKPKSPEEQAKKDKEQKEMVANIKQALSNTPDFDDQSTITNKINSFIG